MTQTKVLIISLGDLKHAIYTLPLVQALKQNDYRVEYLTSEKGFEIVNKNSLIDRVHLAPVEQWLKKMPYMGIFDEFSKTIEKITKQNLDIVIDCEQSIRSTFFMLNCGIPRRLSYSNATGFSSLGANEIIDKKSSLHNRNIHKVESNLNFSKYLGLSTDNLGFTLADTAYPARLKMEKFIKFPQENPIIVLAPDLSQQKLAWHPKNWINLVSNISTKYNILIVGTALENSLANKMSHKNLCNICGTTNYQDLRYVLSLADVVVSDNLETSAIAWASNNKKVITLSTNIDPKLYNPYNLGGNNKYISLAGNLSCQFCNKNHCEHSTYKCSHSPSIEAVLNAIR